MTSVLLDQPRSKLTTRPRCVGILVCVMHSPNVLCSIVGLYALSAERLLNPGNQSLAIRSHV